MARILVVDSDENHAKALISRLHSRRYEVTVVAKPGALNQLGTPLAQFHVIILEFSNRSEDWEWLDKLRRLTVTSVPKPGILCLSRSNWGTGVKLRVEHKGARLVYERPA
jgi:CheY-like chemotaxis protein